MAARRGKTQARRNPGNSGLPGWAWGVLGLVLGIALILMAPKLLKSGGDGFFRPQPNPDAQPVPVATGEDDVVAPEGDAASPPTAAKAGGKPATAAGKSTEYDFYTLLPGKEVPMTEAELAATERAETQRRAQQQKQAQASTTGTDNTAVAATPTTPLPAAVATGNDAVKPPPTQATTAVATPTSPAKPAVAATTDTTRYLLQAGAFEASGQAEELKAKIAMLGLGARVESAAIGGKTVYRVRMGPYGSASELAEAKRTLAGSGLPGMPIKVK